MKRFITVLMLIITFCSVGLAQESNIAQDTAATITDSAYTADYTDSVISTQNIEPISEFESIFGRNIGPQVLVPIVAIVFGCGIPVLVVFFAFYFRYKNRQAKYRVVEEALRSGQPLPEGIFKETYNNTDTRAKGIKNTFTGIGLFVFLYAITGEFGVGSIGLLVMFIGIGQWVLERQNREKKNNSTFNQTDKDNYTESK